MPTVKVEGLGTVNFPDGISESDMTSSIQQALMEKNAPAPTSGPVGAAPVPQELQGQNTYGDYLKSISTPQSAIDLAKGVGKGVLGTVASAAPFMTKGFGPGGDIVNTDASNQAEKAGKIVEGGAELAIPGAMGADALPSAARAGKVFDSIAQDASKAPVQLKRAGDALLELHELGATGSNLPKAVRQLTNRATAPGAGDLLYPEARKFASRISNSSIAERLTSDPNMKRVLGSLREGFNADVGDAAGSVGRGADYEQAMKEYANAKRLTRTAATVGGAAASGLGIGAKLGVLGHILGNITGGQ